MSARLVRGMTSFQICLALGRCIQAKDARTPKIVTAILAGETGMSIAKSHGITTSRVNQITHKFVRSYRFLVANYRFKKDSLWTS